MASAASLQVEVLDSTGCPVTIQGFHTQFKELDGSLGHLLRGRAGTARGRCGAAVPDLSRSADWTPRPKN